MDNHPTAPGKSGRRSRNRTFPAPPQVPIAHWIDSAACAAANPEVFFPASHESDAGAKQYCASCPVRDECRDYALAAGEEFGIWGGLNEDERKAIREEAAGHGQAVKTIGGVA
jgi:WhiB family transcriptional regulator, redox-sensing transcriptional regulator